MTASSDLNLTDQNISPKIDVIETSLQENIVNLKDLKSCVEKLFKEIDKYKLEITLLKERCESQNCQGSETLKKVVSAKDNIIQHVASALTRLNETKNFTIIDDIFKIIFKENTEPSPRKSSQTEKCKENKTKIKNTPMKKFIDLENRTLSPKKHLNTPNKEPITIKEELSNSLEDVSFKDDSIAEIDSTPTRRSPVMLPKKFTSKTMINSPDYGEKKKCSSDWVTPESKAIKLTYTFPGRSGRGGRLRQARLNVFKDTSPVVIDVASLSHLGTRGDSKTTVQTLIKKESSDNDDTIMPSPTSGPNNFLLTKTTKENIKPKRHLSLRNKSENAAAVIKAEDKDTTPTDIVDMEQSINSLNNNKMTKPKSVSPENKPAESPYVKNCVNDVSMSLLGPVTVKIEPDSEILNCPPKMAKPKSISPENKPAASPNAKHCVNDVSMSLLGPVTVKIEPDSEILNCPPKFSKPKTPSPMKRPPLVASPDSTVCGIDESISLLRPANVSSSEILNCPSPKKRPLCENINANNVPDDVCTQASVSILSSNITPAMDVDSDDNKSKRKTPEKVEPVYKEPTVRKKAEKKALPAWCCHECEVFFGALYKDDPDRDEKIANTIKNCSKHRGRNNPARPKTPPGFWDPRWSVPQDTEEFNRRNNAV